MRGIRGIWENIARKLRFRSPSDRAIAFYLILASVVILCIMSLLAITYAGSADPFDLIRYRNFSFAYAGTPDSVDVYSDNLAISLSSINNSVSTVTPVGESELTLYPDSDLTLHSGDNTWNLSLNQSPVSIHSVARSGTEISILTTGEDDFNYGMNFTFQSASHTAPEAKDHIDNWVELKKKSNNQYVLANSSFSSGPKQFSINYGSKCNYSITIRGGNLDISSGSSQTDHVDRIDYVGQIKVTTDGDLNMRIPISAMSEARFFRAEFKGSSGVLDIVHNEYHCSPADEITAISPINDDGNVSVCREPYCAFVSLLNGQMDARGYSTSLEFRGRDFGYPISVIIKEGHFALFTGLLASFLTLLISRLIRQFKAK